MHACHPNPNTHSSGTNYMAVLCWAANPNMASCLWAVSQTMKSHSSNHTPVPWAFSYIAFFMTPLILWVCQDPKLLTSHYAVLPGSVNHSTAPMWNTKIDICGIHECTVLSFSPLYIEQCRNGYKRNWTDSAFPLPPTHHYSLPFLYYHVCLFYFAVYLRKHSD